MDLLLIRHAKAEKLGASGSDRARELSDLGRRSFQSVVRTLGERGPRVDLILHSPLVRAQQTAELLAGQCGAPPRATDALAAPPGATLLGEVVQSGAERVALVGHEPWMGELCSLLVAGSAAPAFSFRPGEVAWLRGDVEPGAMTYAARVTKDGEFEGGSGS